MRVCYGIYACASKHVRICVPTLCVYVHASVSSMSGVIHLSKRRQTASVARELVRATAAMHGRLKLGGRATAERTTQHDTTLVLLAHHEYTFSDITTFLMARHQQTHVKHSIGDMVLYSATLKSPVASSG